MPASSTYGVPVHLNQATQASEETNMEYHLQESFCESGLEVCTSCPTIVYWLELSPTEPSNFKGGDWRKEVQLARRRKRNQV